MAGPDSQTVTAETEGGAHPASPGLTDVSRVGKPKVHPTSAVTTAAGRRQHGHVVLHG